MKRNPVLLSIVAAFILMSSVALAGSGISMRIHVPFDFYVGNQQMRGGDYSVEMGSGLAATASLVTIRSEQSAGIIMLAAPGTSGQASDGLRFNKYQDKYFLSTVSIRGFEANLRMFGLEKELRAQTKMAPTTIIVAQK